MTVRDELERCVEAVEHYDAHGVQPKWAREALHALIRDHGPALLAMVEGHLRYEAVRKMSPPTFTKVFNESATTGVPFDTLVDTWAFNNGYPSAIDQSRVAT